jgi:hypothetical protein
VFGKQGTNAINLPAIAAGTSTDGFVINGKSGNDHKGYLISNAGDVNGDGLDDLIIGAYVANPKGQGKSYVVFGKQDNTAINLSDIVTGSLPNTTYDLSSCALIIKSSKPSPLTSPALADPSGKSNAGKSYVVFGKKDNTRAIELSDIATGTINGVF